ncbi:MAG TPA: YeiH family protein [Rhodopila sp.]|nr:YeiH family protein [Rhodopila sp.]
MIQTTCCAGASTATQLHAAQAEPSHAANHPENNAVDGVRRVHWHRATSSFNPRIVWRKYSRGAALGRVLPGVVVCLAVTLAAILLERLEARAFGRAWLEALVLAIVVGTGVRTAWTPGQHWLPGIAFSAKTLLEIAVVLLGASLSAGTIIAAGPALLAGIAGVVLVAIAASYALGRLLGLRHRLAVLVACGNSICGNSAIAAVAPVIGADGEDVAASIAFTAVLGVAVVLGLPFLSPLLAMTGIRYGILAGLTVYAVPQVLAATAPVGALAMQMGTLVKLVRVLMLGPVVLILTALSRNLRDQVDQTPLQRLTVGRPAFRRAALHRLVPWFILGFLALAALRSFGLVPQPALAPISTLANGLTVISMAALGLSTDLRSVMRAGLRVTAAVTLSLLVLGGISLALISVLAIG